MPLPATHRIVVGGYDEGGVGGNDASGDAATRRVAAQHTRAWYSGDARHREIHAAYRDVLPTLRHSARRHGAVAVVERRG